MMDQAPTLAFKAFGRLRRNKRQDEPRSPGHENLCRPRTLKKKCSQLQFTNSSQRRRQRRESPSRRFFLPGLLWVWNWKRPHVARSR